MDGIEVTRELPPEHGDEMSRAFVDDVKRARAAGFVWPEWSAQEQDRRSWEIQRAYERGRLMRAGSAFAWFVTGALMGWLAGVLILL